jgi:autotransporter passenger strand-loop-strand repeat protein
VTVAAANLLATPAAGSLSGPYLPANTEPYSDGPGYQFSGKPNVTGPDFGPTTFIPAGLQGATQNLTLGMYGPAGEVLNPFAGTSAAAPAVAAVAALMLQANRQLTNFQIDAILDSSANATPVSGAGGAGLVNAALDVQAARALIRPIPTGNSGQSQAVEAAGDAGDPAPTVTLAYLSTPPGGSIETGWTVTLIVDLSEAVTVTGTPTFTLSNNATATYNANDSDPSAGELVFDCTAGSNDYTADLAVTGLSANGALVQDSNGNNADFSGLFDAPTGVTINSPLQVASVASSKSGEAQAGQTIQITITLNEGGVTVNTAGGAPTLILNNNAIATYDTLASSPSLGKLVFDYTIGGADAIPNLSVAAVDLPAGTTVQDAGGNNAGFSVSSIDQNLQLQIGPAFVDGLVALPSSTARTGETVELAVVLSEGVTISATGSAPTLSLNDGAVATYDSTDSNPSTGLLVFQYTVGLGDQTPDLEVTSAKLNGDTIQDANGVAVVLSGVLSSPTGLTINSPLLVTSVTTSQTGQSAQFTLDMSEDFAIGTIDTGSPTLSLSDGTTATYDPDASNPSSGTLVFDDTLSAGEQASGLQIAAVNLNGAVVVDANGNNADFSAAVASVFSPVPVSSGKTIIVSSGQTSAGLDVLRGGTVNVLPGGTTIDTVISGGAETVSSGGIASDTTISGGTEFVYGVASGVVLNSGGTANDYGVTTGTTVAGGLEIIYSGATARGTVISSGGEEYVAAGAKTVSATIDNAGQQLVYGTAISTIVSVGGQEFVLSGGLASGTVVSSGGIAVVESGGSGSADVVDRGGTLNVLVGGKLKGGYDVVFGSAVFVFEIAYSGRCHLILVEFNSPRAARH